MADRYWVAGTEQDWSDSTYWSATSGGTGGASVPGSSDNVIFDGNGLGNCNTNGSRTVVNLTLSSGYTGALKVFFNQYILATGSISVASGATISLDYSSSYVATRASLTVNGTISGPGYVGIYNPAQTTHNIEAQGQINCTAGLRINAAAGSSIVITNNLNVSKIDFDSFAANTCTFNTSTHNPNINITGDVVWDNPNVSWSKGTGTITLSGSANQNIDFDGESVEDIVIDKTAGTVTLTGGVVTDSLTLTSGTLDCGSQTLETVGDFTMAAGTTVTET